jgi:hypothetical protein
MTRINPVIKPVIETFQTVYYQTLMFAQNPESAINGLLVMGDAGTGKSHWIKKALRDAGVVRNTEYIKGGTITAASAYVKFYLNKNSDRIMVFDDTDIIGHPEKNKIIPMVLGAVEEGRDRSIGWHTARPNNLMEEFGVPMEFKFNGNVILITNYTKQNIKESVKQWSAAFNSRFTNVECIFNHEQKYMYTRHLIENEGALSHNCQVHEYEVNGKMLPGYPDDVIEETMDFIDANYDNFTDITPRVAIKIADIIYYNTDPNMRRVMLHNVVR